jgi:hypothetical protein
MDQRNRVKNILEPGTTKVSDLTDFSQCFPLNCPTFHHAGLLKIQSKVLQAKEDWLDKKTHDQAQHKQETRLSDLWAPSRFVSRANTRNW